MQRGHDAVDVDAVLARLRETGLLSEARFANSYLCSRLKRGESPWLAARKARQRGVDEAALQAALEEAEAGFDALAACRELLKRRDPAGERRSNARVWQRQARFLQNRGFDSATILRALNGGDDQIDE